MKKLFFLTFFTFLLVGCHQVERPTGVWLFVDDSRPNPSMSLMDFEDDSLIVITLGHAIAYGDTFVASASAYRIEGNRLEVLSGGEWNSLEMHWVSEDTLQLRDESSDYTKTLISASAVLTQPIEAKDLSGIAFQQVVEDSVVNTIEFLNGSMYSSPFSGGAGHWSLTRYKDYSFFCTSIATRPISKNERGIYLWEYLGSLMKVKFQEVEPASWPEQLSGRWLEYERSERELFPIDQDTLEQLEITKDTIRRKRFTHSYTYPTKLNAEGTIIYDMNTTVFGKSLRAWRLIHLAEDTLVVGCVNGGMSVVFPDTVWYVRQDSLPGSI